MKLQLNKRHAFTLVEIMIVVAIIGMISAIAIPQFMRYRTASQRNTCIANLRQMQNAKIQWAFEKGKPLTDTPLEADLIGPPNYLRDKPSCPGGGADYMTTIGTAGEQATCSLGVAEGHSL